MACPRAGPWTDGYTLREASANPPRGPRFYLRRIFVTSRVSHLGSSSVEVRQTVQPWIEDQVFFPLRARNVDVVHVDMRQLPGVDMRADLTNPDDIERLHLLRPRALLCCNLLEHVIEPDRLARHCLDLLTPGGL